MNNGDHDILTKRIESASAELQQYSSDGFDTLAAITILESKKSELKQWSKKFSIEKRHQEIFNFVKKDNVLLNEKIVKRYITWNMWVMPQKFWGVMEWLIIAFVFIGIPAIITDILHNIYLVGRTDVFPMVVLTFLFSVMGVFFLCGFICSVCTDK